MAKGHGGELRVFIPWDETGVELSRHMGMCSACNALSATYFDISHQDSTPHIEMSVVG